MPVARDDDHILNAYSAPAGQVDARFDGHDHSGFENIFRLRREPRGFVNLQADAVSEAVTEFEARRWRFNSSRAALSTSDATTPGPIVLIANS